MKLREYLDSTYPEVSINSITTQRVKTKYQIVVFSLVEFANGTETLTMRDEDENMFLSTMEEMPQEDKDAIIQALFKEGK